MLQVQVQKRETCISEDAFSILGVIQDFRQLFNSTSLDCFSNKLR